MQPHLSSMFSIVVYGLSSLSCFFLRYFCSSAITPRPQPLFQHQALFSQLLFWSNCSIACELLIFISWWNISFLYASTFGKGHERDFSFVYKVCLFKVCTCSRTCSPCVHISFAVLEWVIDNLRFYGANIRMQICMDANLGSNETRMSNASGMRIQL